jgi:hypothetical protein
MMSEALGVIFGVVFVVMYFGFIMAMVGLTWAGVVVTALAIWDCARRDFADPGSRALWCVLIFLTHWLGALIYYIVIYRTDDPPLQAPVADCEQ